MEMKAGINTLLIYLGPCLQGVNGAFLDTKATPGTCFRVYGIGDERLAYPGWALLIPDMGVVFILEIFQRSDDGVRCSLSQSAE